MSVELKVPEVGESITEVEIGEWRKTEGDYVDRDETVVTLETEKASVDLPAPVSGTVTKVLKKPGETASVGEVIGHMEEGEEGESEGAAKEKKKPRKEEKEEEKKEEEDEAEKKGRKKKKKKRRKKEKVGARRGAEGPEPDVKEEDETSRRSRKDDARRRGRAVDGDGDGDVRVLPAARRLLEEHGLTADAVEGGGKGGAIRKEDVLRHVRELEEEEEDEGTEDEEVEEERDEEEGEAEEERDEEIVPMSALRRRIAERLVRATQEAALLTTFNEIDMTGVIELRERYRDLFQERYDVKLGFMSFFVKASIDALKLVPQVNAEIRKKEIAFRNYYDIGIAVGGGKGLVVPVLRDADRMSFAEVETAIADLARRARENRLELEELQGGTFTITNGGVYGSLLSTPIINPPQSGILGLHKIEDRPVAVDGQVVIRPMMYVALTYDHRIIDGREAVTFLKRIKESIEDPARMLVEV